MSLSVHTVKVDLNWELLAFITDLEAFGGNWKSLERSQGGSLKQLRSVATVQSVGASTRIEGAKLTDVEVDLLLSSLDIQHLIERDQQEVAGYYETLELILNDYAAIQINESAIGDLHNRLLRHSEKDASHRGRYKQHPNHVEAQLPDGSKQIVFQTTPPGYPTSDAMHALVKWYEEDDQTHPLIKIAVFVYELLSIHPFQDGNGRLSRLMATLLLIKSGYQWIQYISFEHVIENRKQDYYRHLRACQALRPGEIVNPWIVFFLDCLVSLSNSLLQKLQSISSENQLSERETAILTIISERPGIQSGEIAQRLGIPNPTVKRLLAKLSDLNLIRKSGTGRSTSYTI